MSTKLFSVECETGDTTYYVDRDSKGNVSISSDSLVVKSAESAESKPKKTTRKRKTKEEGVEEPKKTTRKRTTKAKTEEKMVTRKRTTKAKTEEKVVKETKSKTTRKKKVVDVDDLLD